MGKSERSSIETQAHHVGSRQKENRGRTAGTLGEDTGGEEEVGCLAACGACCCEYAAGFGA